MQQSGSKTRFLQAAFILLVFMTVPDALIEKIQKDIKQYAEEYQAQKIVTLVQLIADERKCELNIDDQNNRKLYIHFGLEKEMVHMVFVCTKGRYAALNPACHYNKGIQYREGDDKQYRRGGHIGKGLDAEY